MGYKALAWAWDQTGLKQAQKFVLVALADMADEGNTCYPGQERLARMTGSSVSTVQRAIKELESGGAITRFARRTDGGFRTSDRYRLNLAYRSNRPVVPTGQMEGAYRSNTTNLTGQIDRVTPSKNHQLTTRGAKAPTPTCGKHPEGTDLPCRACGDSRRIYEARRASEAEAKTKAFAPPMNPRKGEGMCPVHEFYPAVGLDGVRCDKCAEEAEEANAA